MLKNTTVIILIGSLIAWPTTAFAQNSGSWVGPAVQAIDMASGVYRQSQGVHQQTPPQAAPTAAAGPIDPTSANLMNKMVPAANLPLPFQGCLIAQADPPLGGNQCNEAQENVPFLQGMLDGAKNETSGVALSGIKCLEDRVKLEGTKFQNLLNHLTVQADFIKQKNEAFRKDALSGREHMKEVNAILNGGGLNMADRQARSVGELIGDDSCLDILSAHNQGGSVDEINKQGGLLGLRSLISDTHSKAGQFGRNADDIEQRITEGIDEITEGISQGIDPWLNFQASSQADMPPFGDFEKIKQREMRRFQEQRARIREELSANGFEGSPPRMGRDFVTETAGKFNSEYTTRTKKKYVDGCIRDGSNELGPRFGTLSDLLGRLRQNGASARGTTVDSFRGEVAAVLNNRTSGLYIEDKLEAIGAIAERGGYKGIVVNTVMNGRTVSASLHTALAAMVENCRYAYENAKDEGGFTPSQKTEANIELLGEYRKLAEGFQSRMASSLRQEVLECRSEAPAAGTCNADRFVADAPGFCFTQAKTCAEDVKTCHGKVQGLIDNNTRRLKTLADAYNEGAVNLIASQNEVLKEIKRLTNNYAQMINATVPGADFRFPEEMFITPPDPSESELGIFLIGGDDMDSLFDQLPQKIEEIKGALGEQHQKMMGQLQKFIDDQNQKIRQRLEAWKGIAATCNEGMQKNMEQMANQQQQHAEAMQKRDAFCHRFYNWQGRSPAAGCGDAEGLYEDSLEISSFISDDALEYLFDYNHMCAETQNQANEEGDNPFSEAGYLLADCLDEPKETSEQDIERDVADTGPEEEDEETPTRRRRDRTSRALGEKLDAQGAKELLDEAVAADYEAINEVLQSLKRACEANPSETAKREFCDTHSPFFGTEINEGNYTDNKEKLQDIKNVPESTYPINSDNQIPLPSDRQEELKALAEGKLGKVMASEAGNYCNSIATEAIVGIVETCKDAKGSSARSCFRQEYDELLEQGSPRTRAIARVIAQQRYGSGLGENSEIDIACEAGHFDTERSTDPFIDQERDILGGETMEEIMEGILR